VLYMPALPYQRGALLPGLLPERDAAGLPCHVHRGHLRAGTDVMWLPSGMVQVSTCATSVIVGVSTTLMVFGTITPCRSKLAEKP